MNPKELTQHERWKLANELAALQPEVQRLHNGELSDLIKKSKPVKKRVKNHTQESLRHRHPIGWLFNR